MEFQVNESNGANFVNVSGELNIYVAEEFKQQLFACINVSNEITLDLDDVSEIDSSGIQILHVAKSLAAKNNCLFTIAKQSSAINEVYELYGLNADAN